MNDKFILYDMLNNEKNMKINTSNIQSLANLNKGRAIRCSKLISETNLRHIVLQAL